MLLIAVVRSGLGLFRQGPKRRPTFAPCVVLGTLSFCALPAFATGNPLTGLPSLIHNWTFSDTGADPVASNDIFQSFGSPTYVSATNVYPFARHFSANSLDADEAHGTIETFDGFSFWVKTDATPTNASQVFTEPQLSSIAIEPDGTVAITLRVGGVGEFHYTSAPSNVMDGDWHNVIFTRDTTSMVVSIFLDGMQSGASGTAPADFIFGNGGKLFGQTANGITIQDFGVFNAGLSNATIEFISGKSPISLSFPVPTDATCGGTCNANTAPIFAAFDHQMLNAYEEKCPGVTSPANWGKIVDFLGEAANQDRQPAVGPGYGKPCHTLYGYKSASSAAPFLADVNYKGTPTNQVLWYDSHPGYDYGFVYGTRIYAAISGCISYTSPPSDIGNAATFHIVTIIPIAPEPPNCVSVTSATGYFVYYLHLSSFLCEQGSFCPANLSGQVVRKESENSDRITACPECASPGTWVEANSFIGYSGDFAGRWGGVNPHLHFEVDLKMGTTLKPVDPYGWHPLNAGQPDPYSEINPGFMNETLWASFVP